MNNWERVGRRGEGGEGESEIKRHSEVSHSSLF